MRSCAIMLAVILLSSVSGWSGERVYRQALVTHMRMVPCSTPVNDHPLLSSLFETAGPRSYECPEYTLQTDTVRYRVRPRKNVLVPVGEKLSIRLQRRELIIVIDDTEAAFAVLEMKLLAEVGNDKEQPSSIPERTRACLAMDGTPMRCPVDAD